MSEGRSVSSPSTKTNSGKAVLERDPDTPGALGIAISEAVEGGYPCQHQLATVRC